MPVVLPEETLRVRAGRLKHTPLFSDATGDELRTVASCCSLVAYEAGEVIVRQGETADAFYILVDGALEARRTDDAGVQSHLGMMYRGEFCGEMALVDAGPRTATVLARTPATVMMLNRSVFDTILTGMPAVRERLRLKSDARRANYLDRQRPSEDEVLAALQRLQEGLPKEVAARLLPLLEWQWVEAGTVLLQEGEAPEYAYLLLAGRCQAYVVAEGVESIAGEIWVGSVFGEGALLGEATRNASVRCLVNCEVLALPAVQLIEVLRSRPDLRLLLENVDSSRSEGRCIARTRAKSLDVPVPTASEIEHLLHTVDGVARNHLITKGYWRLAVGLGAVLRAPDDANWACYGCRASLTAGASIRGEDALESALLRWVTLEPTTRVGQLLEPLGRRAIRQRVQEMLDTVQGAVATGNLRIFSEIGTVLSRFAVTFAHDEAHDLEKLEAFLDTLPRGAPENEGMDLLRRALPHWYAARFETDEDRRSQLILLGNTLIGVHEQTRVQSDLREALEAPFRRRVGGELSHALFRVRLLRWIPDALARPVRWMLERCEGGVVRSFDAGMRHGLTRMFMKIRLSDRDIRLGTTISGQGHHLFPAQLQNIVVDELAALIAELDPDTSVSAAASDWSNYGERMRFIFRLFRVTQRERNLFDPPYGDGTDARPWLEGSVRPDS